jgi:inhibitor of cysteine peptidase
MRVRLVLVLLALVFAFPAYAETMSVAVGEEFSLTMGSNVTTGFRWQFAEPLDENIVHFVGKQYVAAPNPQYLVGTGGNEIWTFKGVAKGEAVISLEYARSWEKDRPSVRTKTIRVIVN